MLVHLSLLTAVGLVVTGCAAVGGGGAPTETEPPTTAPGGYYGAPAQPGQQPYGQQPAPPAPQQPAPQQPAPQQPAAGFTQVDIRGSAYLPGSINIRVGQKVSWNNEDQVAHTVTADGLTFGKQLPTGAVFNFAFVKPGNFPYHCAIHPNMRGTVVVS